MLKQQDYLMFGLKLNKLLGVISIHLKLLGAVARHKFKWVKIIVI